MMKGVTYGLITAGIAFSFLGFTTDHSVDTKAFRTTHLDLHYHVPSVDELETIVVDPVVISPMLGKSYLGFKEALAFKESGGRYYIINRFGYLGKYQFSKGTLRLVGIRNSKDFVKKPALQEKAFFANTSRNKWVLRKYIDWYSGKRIQGIRITESGLLAAAHLVGPGAVKKYLQSNGKEKFEDAFGTSLEDYMKKFAGYDLSFIQPQRRINATKI